MYFPDDLPGLKVCLEYFKELESVIPSDKQFAVIGEFPLPARLEGLVAPLRGFHSEIIAEKIYLIEMGEHSQGYHERLHERVRQAFDFYAHIEECVGDDIGRMFGEVVPTKVLGEELERYRRNCRCDD